MSRSKKMIFAIIILMSTFTSSVIANPEVILVSGTGNNRIFKVRGGLAFNEVKRMRYSAFDGLTIVYQVENGGRSFIARRTNFVCSKDTDVGLRQINEFMAQNELVITNTAISAGGPNFFRIMCRTNREITGDIYDDVYYYTNWVGEAVDPNSPYCTTTVPTNITFGSVQLGQSKNLVISAETKCDKDADVKISLSGGANGVLDMTGTKIAYSLDNKSTTELYKVKANIVNTESINLELVDTGTTTGTKNGFILMRIEVQ